MKHFNPFPYLACAIYASVVIIVFASRFPWASPTGQVHIPEDEIVITFVAE